MNLKRMLKRALYYVRQGYALASLPFVFMGYASSIYYLAIERINVLHEIFPSFSHFLTLAGLTLPLFCGLVGYVYVKRSFFFKEMIEVQLEANQYATTKFSPISIPANKLFYRMALERGDLDIVNDLGRLLENSGAKPCSIPTPQFCEDSDKEVKP